MQLGLLYLAIALFILLALLKSKGCVRIAYNAVLRVDVMDLPTAWCLARKVAQVNLVRYVFPIYKDGRDTKNIRHRVTKALKIIGALNEVWWSKNITRNRKEDCLQ